MTPREGTFPAPAKLNLFLHVVGRRPDGYHLLQTLFRFIDFGDELQIRVRDDGQIQLLDPLPGVPVEQNLCYRAARLLQSHAGSTLGAEIRLHKRLPMGGGLGGGSSDAATVLMALNHLWGLHLTRAELQGLGLSLGADVPVFVFGTTAYAEGVGELLRPASLPPAWYVVLTPPVHVATAEIFKHPGLTRDTPPIKIAPLSNVSFENGFGHNDLEPLVVKEYPLVGEYLGWLKQYADARMTGSGACVYAAFDSRDAAERVFSERPSEMNGFVAEGLDEHPMLKCF